MAFVLGEDDPVTKRPVTMTASQVRAAQILLNKVLKTANVTGVLNQHCQTRINQSVSSQFNVSGYATPSEFAESLAKRRRRLSVVARPCLFLKLPD